MPAPQAHSNKLKYGMALKTAITFVLQPRVIAVEGGVEAMPSKNPFAKLKSPVSGVNK